MAYSPSTRRQIYNVQYRDTYTQNRQQNINQANRFHESPSIKSPKLNQESDYTKYKDVNLIEELRIKLQTVLKHNSHLLNENAVLSEMVNRLKMEIEVISRKDQADILKATVQYKTTIDELRDQQIIQQKQHERLLDEISRLHDECYRIEIDKNNEIKKLCEQHEKEMTVQIRNFKRSCEDGKELMELQIKKLKDCVELKNFEYEALKNQGKSQNEKLRGEVEELRNQMKHFNQLKEIEMRELYEVHKENMSITTKQIERENSLEVSKLESKVRKMKQDVIHRSIQVEQITKKNVQNLQEHYQETENLRTEKQRLIESLSEVEQSNKENFQKQKERLIQICELEKNNVIAIAENEKQCLKSVADRFSTLCSLKTEQIKGLYKNIAELKDSNEHERAENEKMIEALKKRIRVLQEDSVEQIELLKIKMAQLHESDIVSLEKYYQNEISLLASHIKQLEDGKFADREKIHSLLQQNNECRKNFEVELIKYKAKVQDYKIKFAAANLEFREQITSIGTKMSLASQTLLRETEQKQKGAQFYEAEKRKLYSIIQGKDKEIQSAYENLKRVKQMQGEELSALHREISQLKQNLLEKNNEFKKYKKQIEEQYERKSQILLNERSQSPDDLLLKQNGELRDRVQSLEKQIFAKGKQLEALIKENKSLQQEIGLRAGFLEAMQLESSAAIEDERSKMKILVSENEVAMKDYYQSKLTSREKDIEALKEQLHEKEGDIRQLINKYNQLEQRLKELLEAQERLSDFQKKIVNLGLDQNLVKNMAELFSRYNDR